MREIKFNKAIREATAYCLSEDNMVYVMGLGVPDPKGIFGTTENLLEEFGPERVFDMPIIENGATGIAIGTAIMGMRPIITHQRVEFAILSMEQIVNQAAKWHHMTAGQSKIPLVIRMIIGRGWGQGAQHCQSLETWFAHIPGLKVVSPATPYDAKGLLISSIKDNNPVIFFEHRWLHDTFGNVPEESYEIPLGKANILKHGNDVTLITYSYMTTVSLKAVEILNKMNISVDLIDLRSIKPLDYDTIINSVQKTKRVIVVDNGWTDFGVSSEIISDIATKLGNQLKANPKKIGIENVPIPSTRELAKYCYPNLKTIVTSVLELFDKKVDDAILPEENGMPDVPNKYFLGPF